MDKSLRWDYILEAVAIGGTAAQTKQVFQIISLVLTIVSILVSLAFTLYKWYKEAENDGKITKDEVMQAVEHTAQAVDSIKSAVDSAKDGKDNG